MIKALLLDLDGTLLDDDRAADVATEAFYAVHRERMAAESLEDFKQRWRDITSLHWRRFVAGDLDFTGQRRERAREALGEPIGGGR